MTLKTIPLWALCPPQDNPRRTVDDAKIASLAESIKTDGVLQNLIVEPGEGKTFRVVSGMRRFLALKLLESHGIIDSNYKVPAEIRGNLKDGDGRRIAIGGGKPSVALLRHSDQRIDAQTKARYRAFLAEQLPQLKLPTLEEERANPDEADGAYESVTRWVLTQTRDVKVFGLLFRENVSYGFRRNLWGLKPVGLSIAAIAGAASTGAMLNQFFGEHTLPSTEIVTITGLVWALVVLWLVWFTPSWVRIPADAYGRELLAACETLKAMQGANKRNVKR